MNKTDLRTMKRILQSLATELDLVEDVARRWHKQSGATPHSRHGGKELYLIDVTAGALRGSVDSLQKLLK